MLYELKRRKNTIFDKIDWGEDLTKRWNNRHYLLNLKYRNEIADITFSCVLDCNEKPGTYEIKFTSCDDIFGHIVKAYKTTDFVKVCYMIKFIKELAESADYYGENETKNEVLYKECINTIRQYFNNDGKLDEFDEYFKEL